MSKLTFDDALNEIKNIGEKERETIETAEEIARVINGLADARIKKGLTQRQLAEVTGLKQSAIARMESLQTIPRLDTLIRVARSLGAYITVEESKTNIVNISSYTTAEKGAYKYMQNAAPIKTDWRKEAYAAIG